MRGTLTKAWWVLISVVFGVVAGGVAIAASNDQPVKVGITADMGSIIVKHRRVPIKVQRIQDTDNRLVDDFSKTSRPCPPFCIHPISAAPGVRTIAEVELLDFVAHDVEQKKGFLIDARMPKWYKSETIPGAINLPFIIFSKKGKGLDKILKLLGGKKSGDHFDFTNAKELALFCNGPWCDQSPRAIRNLIALGYPPEKLRYYRGGMQLWKLFGLTTVLPTSNKVSMK